MSCASSATSKSASMTLLIKYQVCWFANFPHMQYSASHKYSPQYIFPHIVVLQPVTEMDLILIICNVNSFTSQDHESYH